MVVKDNLLSRVGLKDLISCLRTISVTYIFSYMYTCLHVHDHKCIPNFVKNSELNIFINVVICMMKIN